ncbi:hypothetical protein B2J88_16740 [Rhodococcus sp. SRB_17]|nr:hypothetical protein [Rhodococcus sp. SRB_17]
MVWEGPVGNVSKEVLYVISDMIKRGIETALRFLKNKLEELVTIDGVTAAVKMFLSKIPMIAPVATSADLSIGILATAGKIREIVEDIRTLVDALREYLDLVTSPSGALSELSEKVLAPVVAKMDTAKKRTELTLAVTRTADAEGPMNVPKSGYSPGSGKDPWADAV